MTDFWEHKKPLAIAHRGGAGLYRIDRFRYENTLEIFKTAVELGYHYLEIDVTNTADKKVIVLHVTADKFEALLHKRSAPSAKKFQKYTYEQLRDILKRDIPLLEQVLTTFPKTKFIIDPKTDQVLAPLAAIIKKTKSCDRVLLNSFSYERVLKLQSLLGGKINYGIIIARYPRLFNWWLRALYRGEYFSRGLAAITIPRRFLDKKTITLIHRHGIKALVWPSNTEPQIKKAKKTGVDGIITDNAALLIKVLSN